MSDYNYKAELLQILDGARHQLSNILPSDWAEQNRVMTPDVSPVPGPFSFKNSPYCREILDCMASSHPSRIIAVKKGSQIGFSTGVIENGIGYIISQDPGNTLFLVGHADLVEDASTKVGRMLDNSGNIRDLIRSNSESKRKTKSGDTDHKKEFPGGNLKIGIANHKMLRNISVRFGFIDDYEAMKAASKESGATDKMVEARFKAFKKIMKLMYISTPELEETSNINPAYKKGDQRKYHVPCPCCDDLITLEWETKCDAEGVDRAGIVWEIDSEGALIPESVGYICQSCGGFFDDTNKTEWLLEEGRGGSAKWIPTAVPSRPGNYSYHINNLYAPPYMSGWIDFVYDYMEANPVGQPRNEENWKVFVNQVLGETYHGMVEKISANILQENIRPYSIGTVPEKLSEADGNGKIVLLTLGCDLNGTERDDSKGYLDDARIDYEIVGHSETGATYSIMHGSIGTFVPNESTKQKRKRHSEDKVWTYQHGAPNSVWPALYEIMGQVWETDTGRKMRIMASGIDVGHLSKHAYPFIDSCNYIAFAIKGKDKDKYTKQDADLKSYKQSSKKNNLYFSENNFTKDRLSEQMKLKFDPKYHDKQPPGFMNFPTPSDGKYVFKNFFSHFEAEQKILDKDGEYRWVKQPGKQNHLYDCRLYAEVTKDILVDMILREKKVRNGSWEDFIRFILKK